MSFQSSAFFIFSVILWTTCWLVCKSGTTRKVFLLAGSYYFYMTFNWRFGLPLFVFSLFFYLAGLLIRRQTSDFSQRLVFRSSLLIPLGVLGYFKYMNFFVSELATVLNSVGLHSGTISIVAPIGISFFTFQGLAYIIDVHRRKIDPAVNVLDFLLFMSFFPSILSGPINRANDLLPQISKGGSVSAKRSFDGLFLITRGFAKKVLFADIFAAHIVDPAFANPSEFSTLFLILAVFTFSLQIYMDLSGYTDIARGLAKIFGFDLMENFRNPYGAMTVSQFWQRWHISMSSFFRDYLFHGLGGSRYGNVYVNLLITFVAIGIWHGAGWNFVLYGLTHGSVVALERYFRLRNEASPKVTSTTTYPKILLQWFLVFSFVSFSRILFRSQDVESATNYINAIFENFHTVHSDISLWLFILVASSLALCFTPKFIERKISLLARARSPVVVGITLSFIFYFLLIFSTGGSGFIYFAF